MCCQLSLSAEVVFCRVTTRTEVAKTEAWLQGRHRAGFLPQRRCQPTNLQPCLMCVSVQRHLMEYTLLIHSHWTRGQQHCTPCLREAYLTHALSLGGLLQPLALRNTTQHFSAMLGGGRAFQTMKWPKAQKCKKCNNVLWKGRLSTVWELKQEGLVQPQPRMCIPRLPSLAVLCMSSIGHVLLVLILWLQRQPSEQVNLQILNLQIMRIDWILFLLNSNLPFLASVELKLFHIWPLGILHAIFRKCPHNFLSTSLLSCSARFSRLILHFLCPSSEVRQFSKKVNVILVENDIEKPRTEC